MKRLPQRMCAVCRESRPKGELLRVLRTPEGMVCLDFSGKKSGRGAYICYDPECLRKARKQHSLERALKCQIPEDIWEQLTEALKAGADHEGTE